jgi:hypothetical protein
MSTVGGFQRRLCVGRTGKIERGLTGEALA